MEDRVKGLLRGLFLGLAVAGAIRLGLALWRGAERTEPLLITLVSFALVAVGYFILSRSGK
jgi:hypothetical protein